MTYLLLDKIKASSPARIVIVASEAHENFGDLNFKDLNNEKYNNIKAYATSKTANILHGVQLAKLLQGLLKSLCAFSNMLFYEYLIRS